MRVQGDHSATALASAERCTAVLRALPRYPEWYPGVSEAEVLEDAEDPVARLVFDAGLAVLPRIECVLRFVTRPPGTFRPTRLSGPMTLGGSGWSLAEQGPQTTTVRLDLSAQMELPGGRMTERVIGARARRFLIEEPVVALKRQAEGGGAAPSEGG